MFLLVTDTSGKDGFVGLVRTGEGANSNRVDVIEEVPLAGGTFSAQLVPQISGLLERRGLHKTDIGAFVVVSGPGSFTGLRVGLAAIKALAEILKKPIVPISLLGVLALFSRSIAASHDAPDGATFRYAVALDAGRGEAFVGEYEVSADPTCSPRALSESLFHLDRLAALLESGDIQWISTPDQPIFDALGTKVSESKKRAVRRNFRRPRTEEVASLGIRKLGLGETVSAEQLEANYIRRTDAEIFAKTSS
jgi:tRNA threonylcarbamoyladenosine biosynthesis protein TsaB